MKHALMLSVALAASAACAQDRGAALFAQHCAVCHQEKGEGVSGFAPRLAGTLVERSKTEAGRSYLAQLIVSGMMGPIISGGEKFNGAMPGFPTLADEEIVAVLGHALVALNSIPTEGSVTLPEVATARGRVMSPSEVRRLRER